MNVAVFVSCHGFGHAARMNAVLQALLNLHPSLHFHLFTRIPDWFFSNLDSNISFHSLRTDVGFVQKDALNVDGGATQLALDSLLPFKEELVSRYARILLEHGCQTVLCDISALGLAIADRAAIPSILLENFTWEWIYSRLNDPVPLEKYSRYLGGCTQKADYRIQLTPNCNRIDQFAQVNPVSRRPSQSVNYIRGRLALRDNRKAVLLSMGGTPHAMDFLTRLSKRWPTIDFIVSGHGDSYCEGNLYILPVNSGLDHPSLVDMVDLVVAKLGYSTLAEAYWSGKPMAVFTRPGYPEMPPLEAFFKKSMHGEILYEKNYPNHEWIELVGNLSNLPTISRVSETRGDVQCAQLISNYAGWNR